MIWEYMVIGISSKKTQSEVAQYMNHWGKDGWELVTIDFDTMWAYFKRESNYTYIGKPCDCLSPVEEC